VTRRRKRGIELLSAARPYSTTQPATTVWGCEWTVSTRLVTGDNLRYIHRLRLYNSGRIPLPCSSVDAHHRHCYPKPPVNCVRPIPPAEFDSVFFPRDGEIITGDRAAQLARRNRSEPTYRAKCPRVRAKPAVDRFDTDFSSRPFRVITRARRYRQLKNAFEFGDSVTERVRFVTPGSIRSHVYSTNSVHTETINSSIPVDDRWENKRTELPKRYRPVVFVTVNLTSLRTRNTRRTKSVKIKKKKRTYGVADAISPRNGTFRGQNEKM